MTNPVLMRFEPVRSCFRAGPLPWLARFYRHVYDLPRRSHFGMLYGAVLRKVFPLVLSACRSPVLGGFHYRSSSGCVLIRYDARNAQFHSIHLDKYQDGYEPETCVLLDAFIPGDSVVWDVGSNWGYFSLYACSNADFRGEVHAFEPISATFHDLQSIVKQAGLQDRVQCHAFALGEHVGTSRAAVPDGVHSGLAMLRKEGTGETVEVRSADSLGIRDPTIIKLDVEGFETAVLKGACEVIRRAKPMIILENWFEAQEKSLEPLRLLEDYGYQLFQPAWAFQGANGAYYLPSRRSEATSSQLGLALLPFAAAERGMFGEYANFFACHYSRLQELQSKFRKVGSAHQETSGSVACSLA